MPQHLLIGNNHHGSSAEHKARTHEYRIPDLFRCPDTVLHAGYRTAFGLRNVQFFKNLFKLITVFCPCNGITVCSDQIDSHICQRLCQIDCGLPAKGGNNTFRLFKVNDFHDVFRSKGLKV